LMFNNKTDTIRDMKNEQIRKRIITV
jgi:hypothetical protein